MALGAREGQVLWMFIRRGPAFTAAGTGGGLALASAFARLASSLIFGVSLGNVVPYAATLSALALAALLACYIPARRAARLDLMISLRYE